jgi:4-amino-4-deoxy-L-arabinose transferase-like glycosyltransferase
MDVQETQVQPGHNGGGVREAAKEVVEHGTSVARLAADDLKQQIGALVLGIGLGLGAAVLAVFGVAFALATVAVALATFLDLWLAMLIVTLAILAGTAVLGILARRQIKKGSPALPQHALRGVERDRLLRAFADLRHEVGNTAKARAKVPAATAAAGFVLGGGLRAAVRLAFRRRRR